MRHPRLFSAANALRIAVLGTAIALLGTSVVGAENLPEFGSRRAASILFKGRVPDRWMELAGGKNPPKYLQWPMPGRRLGRGFHAREGTHQAVDITAPIGTPVKVMAPGIVGYANNELKGFGNVMMVVHAGGWVTLYAHLDKFRARPGAWVRRGDVIALSGNTGLSRGPHLHFALISHGVPLDPMLVMRGHPEKTTAPLQF
ncbi:MAG: M23 family metallopeptidase [Proteobacteria bacterium]|nr:M23 family metallopeptidase [Pseudomonadota bacterium]